MSEVKHVCWACGGEVKRWRGTDGHAGWEWFYTCERCGRTS